MNTSCNGTCLLVITLIMPTNLDFHSSDSMVVPTPLHQYVAKRTEAHLVKKIGVISKLRAMCLPLSTMLLR